MTEEAERAREAEERRALFAGLGVPAETPYRYVEAWSPAPGDVRARYGVVLADGRVTVEHELPRIGHPLRELPGQSWPAFYRLIGYGVEPSDAVLLGMAWPRLEAGLPRGPEGGQLPVSDPDGWESWGAPAGLLWLRMTARYGESPLYAERRRRIDRTWHDSVEGLRPGIPYEADDWKRAEAGLGHLRSWEELAGGLKKREFGVGTPTLEQFLEMMKTAAADLRATGEPFALGHPGNRKKGIPPRVGLWDYTWAKRSQAYRWMADFRKQGHKWLTGGWLKAHYGYGRLSGPKKVRTKRDELGGYGG